MTLCQFYLQKHYHTSHIVKRMRLFLHKKRMCAYKRAVPNNKVHFKFQQLRWLIEYSSCGGLSYEVCYYVTIIM